MKKQKKSKPIKQRVYNIALTENQCNIISNAMDLYARIGLGQIHVIAEHMWHFSDKLGIPNYKIGEKFNSIKKDITGLDVNASYGIQTKWVPDKFNSAFDIHQVIRNRVSWDKYPDGGITVNFDEPMRYSKDDELIKIEEIKAEMNKEEIFCRTCEYLKEDSLTGKHCKSCRPRSRHKNWKNVNEN